ncbi:hypothetical protein ACFY12_04205 [Streptomyces sp. NPDC001339]|uniref:hypothetical protein n=1 Tax=Streptomyces sp. NPDC001339 TaxID=3364563 RepID=UPI0036751E4D
MVLALTENEPPARYLRLAAFCLAGAVLLLWIGRTQRRTGRNFLSPNETMRCGDQLISPPPPSRLQRALGRVMTGFGYFCALGAVVNLAIGMSHL